MSRQSRFFRPRSSTSHRSYRLVRSVEESKLDIPTIDENSRYWYFTHRHKADKNYIKLSYEAEAEIRNETRHVARPSREVGSREPSYTKFKVPFQMICKENYSSSVKRYNEQFCSEISNLIDNQPTAREATYFVRIVSYTTLWPPYHNESEMIDTSRRFYALTPTERNRFQHIMSNDYSYT